MNSQRTFQGQKKLQTNIWNNRLSPSTSPNGRTVYKLALPSKEEDREITTAAAIAYLEEGSLQAALECIEAFQKRGVADTLNEHSVV